MPIDFLEKPESHTKPEPIDLDKEIKLEVEKKICFDTTLKDKF